MNNEEIHKEFIDLIEKTTYEDWYYVSGTRDIGKSYFQNLLNEKDKEIERLNNIINELERYINEEYIYDELGMKIFDASKLQDKLQELKGSVSNG